MAVVSQCKIVDKTQVYKGLFDMTIESPQMAADALPGQFVMIACGEGLLLRRPISIADADKGCLRLVFEVRGKGTKWLGERQVGQFLDILGPLGKGYPKVSSGKPLLIVGGGIGVPPLLFTVKRCDQKVDIILGFRNKGLVMMEEDFKQYAQSVMVCTDDGSYGRKGFVTEPASEMLSKGGYGAVFACGPKPMLRGVAQLSEEHGVKCYVSLEERMGCGLGVCLACAVKVEQGSEETYAHVCKHGPVFDAEEVIFDD